MEDGFANGGASGQMRAQVSSSPKYWVVIRNDSCRTEVLTEDLDGGGEALPVFSFEEEAEMFLWLRTVEAGWRATETTPGQLVSILYGPCARVGRVLLDPLPEIAGLPPDGLASMDREGFVGAVLGAKSPDAADGRRG